MQIGANETARGFLSMQKIYSQLESNMDDVVF